MTSKKEHNNKGGAEPHPKGTWWKPFFDELDFSRHLPAGAGGLQAEDGPEWVQNVLRELSRQTLPSLAAGLPKEFSPRTLGLFLGQLCANAYAIGSALPAPTTEQIEAEKRFRKFCDQNPDVACAKSLLTAVRELELLVLPFSEAVSTLELVAQRVFKSALAQPDYDQAADFFQGFAKGISKRGLTISGLVGRTDATPIYQKLLAHRREVPALRSYSELRQFLIRNGISEQMAGSIKRLQMLCGRIGLRLGKRGRPLKPRQTPHAP